MWFATEAKVAKAFEDHLQSLVDLEQRVEHLRKRLDDAAEVGCGDGGLSAHLRRLKTDLLSGRNELQKKRIALGMHEANWRSAVPVLDAARKAIRSMRRHLDSLEAEAASPAAKRR
jgi:hypothetical protein